jgi:hypothetical protein
MTEDDLTCEQAAALWKQITPHLKYFAELRERMEQRGWSRDDTLYVLVQEIHDRLHYLSSHCHGLSVPHGMGRPPRK